ncbi:MAG: DNA polymerase III subunit beta [Candidatus Onthovivens sp.]|nr:DNA polymerase III subunit beta [Bacilli bacterium]MDY2724661.1 DNA polymerase III subunit beta [Candidatus Onthovivens sp.]MDY5646377.1 DNA polymerase III subunit beta [Candidatus Onthovivens sp.]
MKFKINKNEFLKGLLQVGKIIPIKHTNPIFVNIKLELTTDSLILTGSNGDLSITTSIPFFRNNQEIIRDVQLGSILANSDILCNIVKRLDGEEIAFDVLDDNEARIEVDDKASFNLHCIDANEYADLDFSFKGVKIILDASEIANVVSQVSFAASIKNVKPVLTGVNIEGSGSKINFVATDSARLAKKEVEAEISEVFNTTVPVRTFQEIARSITDEDKITLYINDRRILVELKDTIISSVLLPGTYPNVKNIIPKNFLYTLEVDANDLIKTIETANVFSASTGEKGATIRCYMSQENVVFRCSSDQNGNSSVMLNLFKYTGERLEISFKCEYVLSAVKALKTSEVLLCFQGEMKPFVIIGKNDPSVIQLLTPVKTH